MITFEDMLPSTEAYRGYTRLELVSVRLISLGLSETLHLWDDLVVSRDGYSVRLGT